MGDWDGDARADDSGTCVGRAVCEGCAAVTAGVHARGSDGVEPDDGTFAPEAYSLRSSSHLASRSWRSWLGRLRFRAGAGWLGMHWALALGGGRCDSASYSWATEGTEGGPGLTLTQLEHGEFLSHLILRCWQSTQARMRGAFATAAPGALALDTADIADFVSDAAPRVWRVAGRGELSDGSESQTSYTIRVVGLILVSATTY